MNLEGWLVCEALGKGGRWKKEGKLETFAQMHSGSTLCSGSDGGVCKRTVQTSVSAILNYKRIEWISSCVIVSPLPWTAKVNIRIGERLFFCDE